MKAHLRCLFDHYRSHHDMGRPLLQWIGILGCFAFPLFYELRIAAGAAGFNDLHLRLVAAVLCLGLGLRQWWPATLRRYYIAYSYLVVFYCLSFLLSFTMLKNSGGTAFVVNMVVGAVVISLLVDWRNTLVMLLGGYLLSAAAYWATELNPRVAHEFVFAAAGSLLIVVSGALSHQGQKRVEIRRMRNLYAALAGSIAHEMRNPLAQVRHALDTIGSALPHDDKGEDIRLSRAKLAAVRHTVQQGKQAVNRGQQAIELTLRQLTSRSATDRHRMQLLSAARCVRNAVEAFAYEDDGQRACVQVVNAGDFQFTGDPIAVELVLFNLLKNALYYLPIRPEMQVTLTVSNSQAPCIVVRDTGPGIASEQLPRLFQEFQTAGKLEGTGLGLSFCKRVMTDLGGKISCRSELGRFTEFTLTFPPLAGDANSSLAFPAPPSSTANLRGRSVLIVDDQALNRAVARTMAGVLGLKVVEADHGQRALDLLQAGHLPDVILMDINMPGLSGIETTQAIRAQSGDLGSVPIVALTANTSPEVLRLARAAGMSAVLGKPTDLELLARTLDSVVHGAAIAPAASQEPIKDNSDLLNLSRLHELRRLGVLHELGPGALRDLQGLTSELRRCVAEQDAQGIMRALHTLAGISGELGAQRLHQLARGAYEIILKGKAPDEPDWVIPMEAALDDTKTALIQGYGVSAMATAETRDP